MIIPNAELAKRGPKMDQMWLTNGYSVETLELTWVVQQTILYKHVNIVQESVI